MELNAELGGGLDLASQLADLASRLGIKANPQGKIDTDRFVAAIERHYEDISKLRDLCAVKIDEIEKKQQELISRERLVNEREQKVYGVERLKSLDGRSANLFQYFGGK